MAYLLKKEIDSLPKVGPKTKVYFNKLGIFTIKDLLYHIPYQYNDLSKITSIKDLKQGDNATTKAQLISIANRRAWRRRISITEALFEDQTGVISAIWFNQPFLEKSLKVGKTYLLSGQIKRSPQGLQITSPEQELAKKEQTHTGRIVPKYPLSGKLTNKLLRFLIKKVLKDTKSVPEWLPKDILKKADLITLPEAISKIHFPQTIEDIKKAKKRLAFDELFLLQIVVLSKKQEIHQLTAPTIKQNLPRLKRLKKSLNFELTRAQERSVSEILNDMGKPQPMNRLLEGDVGSGKTLVATMAIQQTTLDNKQSCVMAPTEVLAYQHFKSIGRDLAIENTSIALLTNSYAKLCHKGKIEKLDKKDLVKKIKKGEIMVIIGTHALIQDKVEYNNLCLVIIDEQHRFGVKQRKALKDKTPSQIPHFLSMTATPIPRTLSLTVYGDLDISLLDEMPKHRIPIKTFYIPPEKRNKTYDFVRQEIKKGRQAFVICPLIDESDKLGVRSATREYEKLSNNIFPDLKIGLLHGQMKAHEKEGAMKQFKENTTNILVSTSVVEVGVDIPNASIILIEGTERFGLAQLHQFRGRVGRGKHQSYCFLFSNSSSPKAKERLKAVIRNQDGFQLANADLENRGPGEFFGTRQSGLPELKVATFNDLDLIKKTRQLASDFINNPSLKSPKVQDQINNWLQRIHWE